MATPAPSSLINQLNEFCTQSRTRIESRHRFGINGAEILQEYTHLADNVIQRIYQCATAEGLIGNDTPAAVLALGGYGRCELNPYSDIDIMLVYDGSSVTIKQLQSFANQLISVLWDVGFEVGHSCRSINDCIQATYQDVFSKTSMIEARYIVGAKTVYQEFRRQTSKHFYKRKVNRFITTTIQEWKQRHETYGSTIYLQEPNIKESVGGLRDFHTAIWVAAVRYGIKELDTLAKRKIVPQAIAEACEASLDYLWRLRNELHYVTRRRADSLTFEVQQTIATNLGYTDGENVLAEEQMMRDYYLHAETLFEFASLIIDRVTYRHTWFTSAINRLYTRKLSDGFSISRGYIRFQTTRSDLSKDSTRIMRVFVHAQEQECRVGADVRYGIAVNLNRIDDAFRHMRQNAQLFLSILGHSKHIASTLRRMHRWQVLDNYIPEFAAIRSLVRYNRPHEYTVDEHTMCAIENSEEKTLLEMGDGGHFLNILKSLQKPEMLRLAILLHDVGKGIQGHQDHDHRSVEAAKPVLNRLGLQSEDSQLILFLISTHLEMNRIARQRDLDDAVTIEQFAQLVGDEEKLKMLYLLTFADMRAVSVGIWTEWNAILLRQLYDRTLKHLRGEPYRLKLKELKEQVNQIKDSSLSPHEIGLHFEMMPEQELAGNSPEFIIKQIQLISHLGNAPIRVSCFAERNTHTQLGICTRDTRGTLRRITAVMTMHNVNILSADIETRNDDFAIDAINLTNTSNGGCLSAAQQTEIAQTLKAVWHDRLSLDDLLLNARGSDSNNLNRRDFLPEVRIDNAASPLATIIDIRAADRIGLLFTILDQIFKLNLDVRVAKISTEGFIAMDSFYVTDTDGTKVTNADRTMAIKNTMQERLCTET